jgi:hypothetical protein
VVQSGRFDHLAQVPGHFQALVLSSEVSRG